MGRIKPSQRIKGLQKRGESWEYRRQVNGKREYYVLETPDEAEAIRRVALLQTQNSFQSRDDFENDVDRYLAFKRDTDKHTELTSEWSKGVLDQFGKFVGNKALVYLKRMSGRATRATINPKRRLGLFCVGDLRAMAPK